MTTLLPGSLPGLLTRGCPVAIGHDAERGIVLDLTGSVGARVYASDGHVYVYTFASLALDLTDPAGMDRARAFLGERVGLDVSGGVTWRRDESGAWTLTAGGAALVFCLDFFGSGALPPTWDGVRYTPAPTGMAGTTDPAAALALAVLAVSGGSR